MKLKTKSFKKAMALLLVLVMMVSLFPSGLFSKPVKVKAADTTTWNFRSVAEADQTTIQGTTGEYQGLQVDATNGKFYVRSDWAQFNTGTIIKIPVSGPSTVVIVGYDSNYTYDGTAAENAETTYDYAGSEGFVTLVATGNTYLGSISVTATGEEPQSGSKSWNFRGGQDGAYALSLNAQSGEFDGLLIDATTGKLVARAAEKSDSQINSGTIIKVPVGSAADYTLYINARGKMTWTVDGNALALDDEAKTANAFAADGEYNFVYVGQSGADQEYVELVATESAYIKEIKIEWKKTPAPTQAGNGKADVVDFGCEQFDTAGFNNLLTVEIANQLPVTSSNNILSFTINDADGNPFLSFNDGGKTNHRYRTTNADITVAYDSKSKKDEAENTHAGFIYSNASSTDTVYMTFELLANDILTFYVGSNGNAATYYMVAPDGNETAIEFTNAAGVEQKVFYAPEDGTYKLYCSNEKLVVSRVIREHAKPVKINGTATYVDPDNTGVVAPSGYSVVFTNVQTGADTVVKASGANTFSAYLYENYDYTLSLADANGYVISEGMNLSVNSADVVADIAIKPVSVKNATGKITGLSADALSKLSLDFVSDEVYIPEIEINRETGEFTLKFEAGINYTIQESNVNDFSLITNTFTSDNDCDFNIEFSAKPVYPVSLTYDGIEDTSNVVVTFTNIDEEGYSYTFAASEEMVLRTGRYSVKTTGTGNYKVVQGITPNVNINDAAGSTTIKYEPVESWDFSVLNSKAGIDTIGDSKYFTGLALTGNVQQNKTYLLVNADSTVTVPGLTAGDVVTVKYCYCASFNMPGLEAAIDEKSGSTSQIDSVSVTVSESGDFVISGLAGTNASQTYICSITVLSSAGAAEYREVLEVGADKEFKTINEALDEVRRMARDDGAVVTIMIDPGNYEEMLVIDTPDVVLKNSAEEDASIELTNKGVDIAENAVRVTWYYGHGYTYYSMNEQCKYDEELLAANKSNGYASFKNPGSGTTNGSYWNATVIISASNVSAEGIIFENSFNQYVSEKAAQDVIEAQPNNAKEGTEARATLPVGSTKVQEKEYVERAAALAMYSGLEHIYFKNCKFVGRQDTLYGGVNTTVAFEDCAIYGGTDYIFGGMVAVFSGCDLVFNTNDQTAKGEKDDIGYITAAQQSSGRGYLFLGCHVTSTTPGVDTASEHTSKPGDFGRPWQGKTSETIFVNTTVDAADAFWVEKGLGNSLIRESGWNSSLGGEAPVYEYNTIELADVDNSEKRVAWSTVLNEPVLADGTELTVESFLGDWYPFEDELDGLLDIDEFELLVFDVAYVEDKNFFDMTLEEKVAVQGGSVASLTLGIKKIDELSEEELALINGLEELEGFTLADKMDITINVSTDITGGRYVTQTSPIIFYFAKKDGFDVEGRTYALVKIHDNVASIVDYEENENYIMPELNEFSTYVLAYKDTVVEPEPTPVEPEPTPAEPEPVAEEPAVTPAPSTGDSSPVMPFAFMMIGALGVVLVARKKKEA